MERRQVEEVKEVKEVKEVEERRADRLRSFAALRMTRRFSPRSPK